MMIHNPQSVRPSELESSCVGMLAALWHAPDPTRASGRVTAGPSEAAMLGGIALKRRWRSLRVARGAAVDQPNLVCGPLHVAWHRFARDFGVELREVPIERDRFILRPAEAVKHCDENTIGVVATLGATLTLKYDPVKAIARALDRLQAERGVDVPIHVDGAGGALVAPLLQPEIDWDFSIARVRSISAGWADGTRTTPACAWAIWREVEETADAVIEMPTPDPALLAQQHDFLRGGQQNLKKAYQACVENSAFFAQELSKLGFDVLHDGSGGLPGVCWALKRDAKERYSLYDLSERLRGRGWQTPAYALPAHPQEIVVQRLDVKQGMTRELLRLLVDDIVEATEYLAEYAPRRPASGEFQLGSVLGQRRQRTSL